ncbi:MAG: LytTR family transcriptional regulator DNA-binding domain-containing protein, partial [Oscillospiraceae bacterium]|nr:LytTR family transcriptional regulator DNA-binding domain-containing protein [Oscillospiraceae bacterium]
RALQTLDRVKRVFDTRQKAEGAPPIPVQPQRAEGRLMLRHREGVHFLNMDDILLVQRENRATVLYTVGEGRYVTSDALGEMEEKLDAKRFYRCHKSYIINLNHIESITPYGRWTYVVKLRGTRQDALITHEKYEELEKMFG